MHGLLELVQSKLRGIILAQSNSMGNSLEVESLPENAQNESLYTQIALVKSSCSSTALHMYIMYSQILTAKHSLALSVVYIMKLSVHHIFHSFT